MGFSTLVSAELEDKPIINTREMNAGCGVWGIDYGTAPYPYILRSTQLLHMFARQRTTGYLGTPWRIGLG